MSKLQVWSPEEVAEIRPDVQYHVVDISGLSEDALEQIVNDIKARIKTSSDKYAIEPLPYERFDVLDIRAALRHLQQAKHIGKVVCVMPEFGRENAKLTTFTPLFNDNSTYIVTGGLGGIGFEFVKWMLRNGAKHIAIISRSIEVKPEISKQIKSFNEGGKHVQHFAMDVSDFELCCEFFKSIQNPESGFPKIRGVMHAAGVLDDAIFANQSWSRFVSTHKPKVDGSWNLHLLTKDLKLEHFIMFSSIASLLGSPGQANYCSSNSFQDALAHYRHSIGLPAITINWGNWGEVGVAMDADFPGTRPISNSQGLGLLNEILRSPNVTQIAAANIDSFSLLSKLIPTVKHYVDDPNLFGEQEQQTSISSDEFWAAVDAAPDREGKLNIFKTHIKSLVRITLKMGADEPIGDFVEFQSLGIDSLMMLEMKNSLQNALGSRLVITASQIRDCNNVHLLATRFLDLTESKEDEAEMPSLEELRQLIHEDCKLCDDIICPVAAPVKQVDIKVVFITGCTGALGSYILRDISKLKGIQKIYCLVRKRGLNQSAHQRLEKILDKENTGESFDRDMILEVIEGDVALDNFGLDQQIYEKLATEVDAVIHCAAKSDHIAKYWKAPAERVSNIRNVNVLGTKRVLNFASHLKTKHVFYASALIVASTVDKRDQTLSEDWQQDTAFDSVAYNSGYPISKFISEQLVRHAGEKGIPCKALRFALVSGDGKTGELDILTSHYMIRLLAFMKLGCMPDSPLAALLVPPNVCSEALLRICFNEQAPSGVYNVVPPFPQMEQVFVDVAAELGITVQVVTLSEFYRRLALEGDDSPIAPLKRIYIGGENVTMQIVSSVPSVHQWIDNSSSDFFISKKLTVLLPGFLGKIEPAMEIMRRDIRFAKKAGAFEMIGISTM